MLLAEIKTVPLDAKDLLEVAARVRGQDSTQLKLLLGALLAVAALIFLFVWLRKKRRHQFRRSAWADHEHRQKFSAAKVSAARSRGRRRRREHRPRNPTLDQTGGLPPKREE